ncbi:MAG: helix-turn-helix transcriptional regulator [Acidimicrobiales bacterium]
MDPTTTLVPPRRLGTLLREARVAAGRELTDLTTPSGLTVVELDDIEHGRRSLDESTLTALVATYGIDHAEIVPARSQLVIDLDEGRIAVENSAVDVDTTYGADAVLTRYLSLVYRLRAVPLGTEVSLRDVDVEVLGSALSLADGDIEARLHRLMATQEDIERDQRRIRRQLLLPLVGVVIAATGLGTLVLVADPGSDPTVVPGATQIGTPAIEEPGIITDLGPGGAIEINSPD